MKHSHFLLRSKPHLATPASFLPQCTSSMLVNFQHCPCIVVCLLDPLPPPARLLSQLAIPHQGRAPHSPIFLHLQRKQANQKTLSILPLKYFSYSDEEQCVIIQGFLNWWVADCSRDSCLWDGHWQTRYSACYTLWLSKELGSILPGKWAVWQRWFTISMLAILYQGWFHKRWLLYCRFNNGEHFVAFLDSSEEFNAVSCRSC